jgi:hypothetical protein
LNDANLEDSYKAVYVWEQGNNAYTIVNNGSAAYTAALGQAFMVKAKTGATQMSFTTAMQTHAPTAVLKSSAVTAPEIKLVAQLSNQKTSTVVKFSEGMNSGLDVGYDAGILKSGFDLYTSLVEDNGVDFGMQFLPSQMLDKSEIALGIESRNSGLVTFSVETTNLPFGSQILLEDRLSHSFTSLSNGEVYTAQIEKNVQVRGRFFLHTFTYSMATKIGENSKTDNFKVYQANDNIVIAGQVRGNATATLYNLLGSKIKLLKLEPSLMNFISTSDMKGGVYLLSIQYEGGTFSQKIPVNK